MVFKQIIKGGYMLTHGEKMSWKNLVRLLALQEVMIHMQE